MIEKLQENVHNIFFSNETLIRVMFYKSYVYVHKLKFEIKLHNIGRNMDQISRFSIDSVVVYTEIRKIKWVEMGVKDAISYIFSLL